MKARVRVGLVRPSARTQKSSVSQRSSSIKPKLTPLAIQQRRASTTAQQKNTQNEVKPTGSTSSRRDPLSTPHIPQEAFNIRRLRTKSQIPLEEDEDHIIFPRERVGVNYELNWTLNYYGVTPKKEAFKNPHLRLLLQRAKGKLDKNKALHISTTTEKPEQYFVARPKSEQPPAAAAPAPPKPADAKAPPKDDKPATKDTKEASPKNDSAPVPKDPQAAGPKDPKPSPSKEGKVHEAPTKDSKEAQIPAQQYQKRPSGIQPKDNLSLDVSNAIIESIKEEMCHSDALYMMDGSVGGHASASSFVRVITDSPEIALGLHHTLAKVAPWGGKMKEWPHHTVLFALAAPLPDHEQYGLKSGNLVLYAPDDFIEDHLVAGFTAGTNNIEEINEVLLNLHNRHASREESLNAVSLPSYSLASKDNSVLFFAPSTSNIDQIAGHQNLQASHHFWSNDVFTSAFKGTSRPFSQNSQLQRGDLVFLDKSGNPKSVIGSGSGSLPNALNAPSSIVFFSETEAPKELSPEEAGNILVYGSTKENADNAWKTYYKSSPVADAPFTAKAFAQLLRNKQIKAQITNVKNMQTTLQSLFANQKAQQSQQQSTPASEQPKPQQPQQTQQPTQQQSTQESKPQAKKQTAKTSK